MAKRWFCNDPLGDGFSLFDTAEEAKDQAEKAFEECQDAASSDGWFEETDGICWGEVRGQVVLTSSRPDPDGNWDAIEEYELVDPKVEQPSPTGEDK